MSRIVDVQVMELSIPFDDPGQGEGLFIGKWTALDFVLLRLTTDDGLTGWGEAFSYFCRAAVASVLRESIAPVLRGRDIEDLAAIVAELQQKLHIVGRYGITMFAISAADIAMHDLVAKARGVSLADYFGGRRREKVDAYASLVRYADSDLVARIAEKAAAEGYAMIKLHEIDVAHVRAARHAIGPERALTNDVNCNWRGDQVRGWSDELRELDLLWLEEPIFPPEAYAELATLGDETGLALSAGENCCTRYQFAQMMDAGAVTWIQPSLTKIGGFTETMATRDDAQRRGQAIAHHAPYFGPGALATLQVLANAPEPEYFEYLYIDRQADLFGGAFTPVDGTVAIPDGPGLGIDPDEALIERYAVS